MRDIFRVKNKEGLGPIVTPTAWLVHLVEPTGRHYCGVTGRDLPNPPLGRRRLDMPLKRYADQFTKSMDERMRLCSSCLAVRRARLNRTVH